MAEIYRLFGAGLKWSYRKYGTKGAIAFVLAGAVAYYLLNEKFEELAGRDASSTGAGDTSSTREPGASST